MYTPDTAFKAKARLPFCSFIYEWNYLLQSSIKQVSLYVNSLFSERITNSCLSIIQSMWPRDTSVSSKMSIVLELLLLWWRKATIPWGRRHFHWRLAFQLKETPRCALRQRLPELYNAIAELFPETKILSAVDIAKSRRDNTAMKPDATDERSSCFFYMLMVELPYLQKPFRPERSQYGYEGIV